jgi:hypothetical protein
MRISFNVSTRYPSTILQSARSKRGGRSSRREGVKFVIG